MKYKTVKITKSGENYYYTIYKPDNLDREDIKTAPNSWGFYHYPETMSDEEAFDALKEKMIQDLLYEANVILQNIGKLQKLRRREIPPCV